MNKIEKAAADYRAARAAVEDAEGAIERHEALSMRLLEIRTRAEGAVKATRQTLLDAAKETP